MSIPLPTNPAANASKDPTTFTTQVNDAIADLAKAIESFIDKMAGFVNDHLTEIGGVGGLILSGPFGALIGGLTAHELKDRFEGAIKQIREKWEEIAPILRQTIGSIIGDPLEMGAISSAYRDAADAVGRGSTAIGDGNALLGTDSFNGRAKAAYTRVSETHNNAALGLQVQLLNAADVMDDNEVSMLKHWNAQLANLLNATGDFLSVAGDLGNVGNAPTFEVGPALKLLGKVVSNASAVVEDFDNYFIDLNVGSAGDWDGLNSSFGRWNLPNDQWPRIDAANNGALNEPWTPAS